MQSLGRTFDVAHWIKGNARIPRERQVQRRRQVGQNVFVTDQHDTSVRIPDKHRHRRQKMIHLPPQKPDGDHQRRVDGPQCLVEVGAVLFRDVMHPMPGHGGPRCVGNRVQITDQRIREPPNGPQPIGPAVRRHHGVDLVQ